MAADGVKIKILKQYDVDPRGVNPLDPASGKIRLHDAGAPGEVIVLNASQANALIVRGWAVAV